KNPASDKRYRFRWKLAHRIGRAPSALVAVSLYAALSCTSSWAQALNATAGGANRLPVQTGLPGVEKTNITRAVKLQRSSAGTGADKLGADKSKNEDNQTPFGAFNAGNRGPITIQSDSLALDYKQNAVLFSGHVHATQADGALSSDTLNVKYGKDFHQ